VGWTREQKIEATIRAPIGRDLHREDTRVIERPGWYQIITPSTRGSILNEVLISQVAEAESERVIDEVIASYRAHGLPVKWCVGPWTEPADFGERLQRRGFVSWDVRGMACDTSLRLEANGVAVEAVTETNLDEYLDAFVRGWGVDPDQREPLRLQHSAAMRADPRTAHFFLARVDGKAAGTTGVLLRKDYAYLVGAHVLDAFRGRGFYRALIEARLAMLRDAGITLAVTLAREATSAPMLEHLGFETLFPYRCYLLER
jgi:GNAT superfamily N-acetyltransferase